MREWKACNSLLSVTGFPYCRFLQSQLCALRAPFLFRTTFGVRLSSRLGRLAYHWGTADNLFTTKSSQVARPILRGSVYLIGSLPAALYKLFIFSFKVSVIFVKLLCHIFICLIGNSFHFISFLGNIVNTLCILSLTLIFLKVAFRLSINKPNLDRATVTKTRRKKITSKLSSFF